MAQAVYTWGEFKAAVISFVTDRQPSDEIFTAAVAEYVRARIARDMLGDANLFEATQRQYTTLRRALAGYATTLTEAQLREAVRVQLSEGARTPQQAARAAGLFMRSELAREVDARGAPENMNLWQTYLKDYVALKVKLCGFAATSQTEAEKFLPLDAVRQNTTTLRAALYATAIEDLLAFGTWLNGQIATAKSDLEGLADRVQKELRAGVIDLQNFVRAYQVGHEEVYTEFEVEEEGMACTGNLPAGAQVREAWVRYPGAIVTTDTIDDDIEDRANERRAEYVAWEQRLEAMIGTGACRPQIAIDPKGGTFLLTPKLLDREIELRLVYDGVRLEFEDDDDVPFDEDAARAVGYKINAELCAEWGEAVSQSALWEGKYRQERSRAYLKHKRLAEVA